MEDRDRRDERVDARDPKGERGGDTGKTDQKGKGVQAEKGDQRREKPVHTGPTRRGARNRGSRPGSDSDDQP